MGFPGCCTSTRSSTPRRSGLRSAATADLCNRAPLSLVLLRLRPISLDLLLFEGTSHRHGPCPIHGHICGDSVISLFGSCLRRDFVLLLLAATNSTSTQLKCCVPVTRPPVVSTPFLLLLFSVIHTWLRAGFSFPFFFLFCVCYFAVIYSTSTQPP